VVDIYNRGGAGAGSDFANTSGFGTNPTNRAPAILPLNLSAPALGPFDAGLR
jgi:hypothetical protein